MPPAHEFENANFNLFQAIVEQAPDAIIFADREGAIRVWNRGAEAVFGYAAAEVLGNSLDVIIPERNRADLDDVPADVREAMRFHPVMTLGEVLDLALEPKPQPNLQIVT